MRFFHVAIAGCLTSILGVSSVTLANADSSDFHIFFKAEEHKWLGDQVNLEFPGVEAVSSVEHKLKLPNGNALAYGDIVSLGGDYYGIPQSPISDGKTFEERVERFKAAFDTLAEEVASYGCDYDFCANRVLDVFEQEHASKASPSDSRRWDHAAALNYYTSNNFLQLAIYNWDHFIPTSILAYEAGHAAAIEQALKARELTTPQEQTAALELAYAMNAFADHYLTDMFSAGHVRVPRRELYEQSTFASVGGLLAKQMHDEDGRVGLTVHNRAGVTWKMYGDGELFLPEAETNRNQVGAAIRASSTEVSDAFKTGVALKTEDFGIKKLIPLQDELVMHPASPEANSSPLYSLNDEGIVLARVPLNSRCSYDWTADWSSTSQLLGYSSAGDGSDCKFNPEP